MLSFISRKITLFLAAFFIITFGANLLHNNLLTDDIQTYRTFLSHLFQGDLGISIATGEPVMDLLMRFLPPTLTLCVLAITFALIIGIILGVIAALNPQKNTDLFIVFLSHMGYSVPVYWLGMLFVKWFSLDLGWLPPSGQISLIYDPPIVTGFPIIDTLLWDSPHRFSAAENALQHMLLPVLVLAIIPTTEITRNVRNSMVIVMRKNYIKTALARGKPKHKVAFDSGLRNILPNIYGLAGLQIGNILTGAIMTEIIFDWPGIGTWLVQSIMLQDYNSVIAGMITIAGLIILINTIIEILVFIRFPIHRRVLNALQS